MTPPPPPGATTAFTGSAGSGDTATLGATTALVQWQPIVRLQSGAGRRRRRYLRGRRRTIRGRRIAPLPFTGNTVGRAFTPPHSHLRSECVIKHFELGRLDCACSQQPPHPPERRAFKPLHVQLHQREHRRGCGGGGGQEVGALMPPSRQTVLPTACERPASGPMPVLRLPPAVLRKHSLAVCLWPKDIVANSDGDGLGWSKMRRVQPGEVGVNRGRPAGEGGECRVCVNQWPTCKTIVCGRSPLYKAPR